jgi:hypothetical protein
MREDESELLQLLAGIRAVRRQVHQLIARLKDEQQAWAARTQHFGGRPDEASDGAGRPPPIPSGGPIH